MHGRDDQHYVAATMYYVQGDTMDTIARHLGTSRSTVSRLLKEARDRGVVHISVAPPSGGSPLTTTIQRLFGVTAHIVPVREGSSEMLRLDRVARVAGRLLSDCMSDNHVLGIAWGTTLGAVVQRLVPRDVSATTVVQLNGGANPITSGISYVGSIIQAAADAYNARVVHFPVPAFFDYPQTKQVMWRERSVRNVLQLQRRIDVAIFGVGALDGPLPSHVYSAGYLDDRDLAQLRKEHVVGDVNTVFLREDGSWADVSLNSRATGVTPAELQRIPRRICVVAGIAKAASLMGALRARVATDVVLDDATARALLDRL